MVSVSFNAFRASVLGGTLSSALLGAAPTVATHPTIAIRDISPTRTVTSQFSDDPVRQRQSDGQVMELQSGSDASVSQLPQIAANVVDRLPDAVQHAKKL